MNIKSKKLFVLNLERGVVYDHPECQGSRFSAVLTDYDKEGNEVARQIVKDLPGSLTWLPGETKRGLPDNLRSHPVLQRALARGMLSVVLD